MIKLLYLILSLFIIEKFTVFIIDDIVNTKQQINIIENGIKKNQTFLEKKEEILQKIKLAKKIDKENRKYFYPSNMNKSLVFTNMESLLKNNNINFSYTKWLNIIEKKYFNIIPIEVRFKATPKEFEKFVENICEKQKIITVNFIKINSIKPRNGNIKYNIIFYAYQLKGN